MVLQLSDVAARLDRLDARTQQIEQKLDLLLARLRIPATATQPAAPGTTAEAADGALAQRSGTHAQSLAAGLQLKKGPYAYDDLDASKTVFRVLAINGADSDEAPLVAELITQDLMDEPLTLGQQIRLNQAHARAASHSIDVRAPRGPRRRLAYSALSYTWGAPDRTDSIVLSGHAFPVTKNLHAALKAMRRLRRQTMKRFPAGYKFYFWIDAICINQDNLAERAHQVGLMRRIYNSAASVDVWLGPEADGSRDAIALMEQLQNPPRRGPGLPEPTYPDLPDEQRLANWKALECLFRRAWWERSWVRQEVALGSRVDLYCGDAVIPFFKLKATAQILEFVVDYLGFQPLQFLSRFSSRASTFVNIEEGGEEKESVEHAHSPPHHQAYLLSDVVSKVSGGTNFMSLKSLLIHMRTCRATDPRDKVYSVLGLADYQVYGLQADYRADVSHRDVFTAATRSIFKNEEKNVLDLLSACQNPDRHFGLPSWVPNLLEEWKYRPLPQDTRSDNKADFQLDEADDVLRLRGWQIGQVSQICPDIVHTGDTNRQLHVLYSKWQQFAQSVFDTLGEDNMDRDDYEYLRLGPCGMWKDQSWLTFISADQESIHLLQYSEDGVFESADNTRRLRVSDERLVKSLLVPEDSIDETGEYEKYKLHNLHLRTTSFGRRLGFTNRGCMGLFPSDVTPGDSVVWFVGGNVGYVLRDLNGGSKSENPKRWALVGDVYLPNSRNHRRNSQAEYFAIV